MTRPVQRTKPRVPTPARGDCATGKVQYATRKQARQAARKMPGGTRCRTFPCPRCGWFHVGHVPQRVRNGEVEKAAWLKATRKKKRRARR